MTILDYDPRLLLVKWTQVATLPIAVSDRLEIATRWRPFKRASVSLVCSPDGPRMMLRAKLPSWGNRIVDLSHPPRYASRTFIGLGRGNAEAIRLPSALIEEHRVNVVLTRPLNENQQGEIRAWFRRGAPDYMMFTIGEDGAFLAASAENEVVQSFLTRCAAHSRVPAGRALDSTKSSK